MDSIKVIEAKLTVAECIERVKNIAGNAGAHASMGGGQAQVWEELQDQLKILHSTTEQALRQVNRNVVR